MARLGDGRVWRAALRGAVVGLAVIVPVTIVRAVVERHVTDFSDSGWVYPLSVLVLLAYLLAGWAAARAEPGRRFVVGALAGAGVVLLWLPVRVVIWAVRESGRGLLLGSGPALAPGQVLGALALGAALGVLGTLVVRQSRAEAPARAPAAQRGA